MIALGSKSAALQDPASSRASPVQQTKRSVKTVLDANATTKQLIESVRVSESQAAKLCAAEQGTEAWLIARRGSQARMSDGTLLSDKQLKEHGTAAPFRAARLTASVFGTALGHNKYASEEDLIKDMLWGTVQPNADMAYGSMMEDVACEVFEKMLFLLSGGATKVEHAGLMLDAPTLRCGTDPESGEAVYEGWAGTSPDGLVHVPCDTKVQLLEIKCPSRNKSNFYSDRNAHQRFCIPWYYYDQIQGIMGLRKLSTSYFVVYLPDRTQILKYEFNAPYFKSLLNGLRDFWYTRYIPEALACARGEIARGHLRADADLSTELEDIHGSVERWIETELQEAAHALTKSVQEDPSNSL